jgi:lipoprotein-releasing system permease protein
MKISLPLRIAFRYVFTLRSFHFITVISTISIIGIIVGVAALICVLSIFNGFKHFTERQLVSYDPHIRITTEKGVWLNNYDSIISKIKEIKSIKSIAPVLQSRVVARKGSNIQIVVVNGIKENNLQDFGGIARSMVYGNFLFIDNEIKSNFDGYQSNNFLPISVGAGFADKLKLSIGDTITLNSLSSLEKSMLYMYGSSELSFIITGIFQTNIKEYDEFNVYFDFNSASKLLDAPKNSTSSLDIRLNNLNEAENVSKEINKILLNYHPLPPSNLGGDSTLISPPILGGGRGWYNIQTWYDLHKTLYNIMQFERMSAFIILSLIIIMAVFNVLASLSMTVVEKQPDISVLKAIGSTNKLIQKIYLYEGIIIGIISTFLGALLGLGLCYGQLKYSWFTLDSAKYLIRAIPVLINKWDIVFICIFSLILSFIAAIYPARRAAEAEIISSLRQQ